MNTYLINQFAGDLTLWTREGSSLVRNMDMGRMIGMDPTGQATSWMRVVINQAGEVITAYPIVSP